MPGAMPAVEKNYWRLPSGPAWAWWILAILPLDTQAQVKTICLIFYLCQTFVWTYFLRTIQYAIMNNYFSNKFWAKSSWRNGSRQLVEFWDSSWEEIPTCDHQHQCEKVLVSYLWIRTFKEEQEDRIHHLSWSKRLWPLASWLDWPILRKEKRLKILWSWPFQTMNLEPLATIPHDLGF